ncbi:MAG: DUF2268 domain-containing protein [Rikenellaceae bacterium]|jgi:hypothetical protein|nr:DUF2268 domain-containing protein [Rikenellaceae bacterium]
MRLLLKIVPTLLAATAAISVNGQYYSTGEEPTGLRWRQMGNAEVDVIFPAGSEGLAARTLKYMDTVRRYVGYGYRYGAMRSPLVLHTRNFMSNGIAMWAPKRMEFVAVPDATPYSEPWLKQLATHEYRHNVQYSNQNRGWIKAGSYVLGEQLPLAALILMPLWYTEGDAVLCETQLSTFGRGRQPSFTIDYRMWADEKAFGRFAMDKWFCGSYKHNIPDHYHIGYQMVSWADNHYGENIWDKVIAYGTRNAPLLFTKNIALRKYYNTNVRELFNSTFSDLQNHWALLPHEENSSRAIDTPTTSFTTYAHPIPIDNNRIIAFKSDFDRSYRIVEVDRRSGVERVVCHTGIPSSVPSYRGGMLWWTEYRSSALRSQTVNSQLCWAEVNSGRKGVIRNRQQALYPVALADGVAMVEYGYDGRYTLTHNANRLTLPDSVSVHGFTYDHDSKSFFFIGLSAGGMWIGAWGGGRAGRSKNSRFIANRAGFAQVTDPAHITIANLRASRGRLYFNSIASGRDEAHCFELDSEREYRISNSTYGSFSPMSIDGKNIVMTTYTREGYRLAVQNIERAQLEEVDPSPVPSDRINPLRRKWNVFNVDDVRVSSEPEAPVKKYRSLLHSFRFHSWAPLYFEPDNVLSGYLPTIYAGVTLMSQNTLGNTNATLQYAYTPSGSMYRAVLTNSGLPVRIGFSALYGGGNQSLSPYRGIPAPPLKHYLGLNLNAYLPLILSSGYHSRTFTPLVELGYSNSLYPNVALNGYYEGRVTLGASLQYTDNTRMAYRDFLPRLGYTVNASLLASPVNRDFGEVVSLFGRLYLPGVALHHSLRLRGYGFHQFTRRFVAAVNPYLKPHNTRVGLPYEQYVALGADYQLPLCYPDGGWRSVIYVKRLRLNLGGCYSEYRLANLSAGSDHSFGGDLYVDFVPLRLPPNVNLTLGLSAYRTAAGMYYGYSLSIPF